METDSVNYFGSTTPPANLALWTIFTSYFIIGLTAFGMAIIQKLKAMVIDKHWLSEEEVNEGMAMVQLYPGPLDGGFQRLRGL